MLVVIIVIFGAIINGAYEAAVIELYPTPVDTVELLSAIIWDLYSLAV